VNGGVTNTCLLFHVLARNQKQDQFEDVCANDIEKSHTAVSFCHSARQFDFLPAVQRLRQAILNWANKSNRTSIGVKGLVLAMLGTELGGVCSCGLESALKRGIA